MLRALLACARPRQWVKNGMVVAAPLFAGELTEPDTLWRSALAVVAFCIASSGVYLLNDARDVEHDRAHPVKRHRPVAAGRIAPRTAAVAGVAGMVVACALGVVLGWQFVLVVAVYCVANVAYTLVLKHEPVFDIATIALGFLLRAVAGGLASDIELSQWFLLVASFGSLFMAAGKRYGELRRVSEADLGPTSRRALAEYSESYLRFVWSTSAGLVITAYSLWAFEVGGERGSPWVELSLIPFVLGVLRYARDVDAGMAEEPEEAAFRDRALQLIGVVWLACVVVAVYQG